MNKRLEQQGLNQGLIGSGFCLVVLGFVMLASASMPIASHRQLGAFFYAKHQACYLLFSLSLAIVMTYIPMRFWQQNTQILLFLSFASLSILLIPGLSRSVNGSTRWFFIGPISIQVSEFVKLALILYQAHYLVRFESVLKHQLRGFVNPLIILAIISTLLLLEPDFGATAVICVTALGMMFLAGAPFKRFLVLLLICALCLAILSVSSPYRLQRMTAFLNPWADQFSSGYQLTQSLIAFGRGGWLGMGLGRSLQKLHYLPEAHTDFLYAVIAEELGLIGALLVLILFCLFVANAFKIGRQAVRARQYFSGNVAYGIAIWFAVQAMINIGVNLGVLPTKGLTLPLMSYGGSSILVAMLAFGCLLRIDFELKA